MASAKLRYATEVAKATEIFTAPDASEIPRFLSRWEAHRQNIMEAFNEYKAAVGAYLEAARAAPPVDPCTGPSAELL
jgi:hypothetical protein